jgi:hypothetical protein
MADPKITRAYQPIFAKDAPLGLLGVEQFGSFASGPPNYTKDPATIMALTNWWNGIAAALVGGANPNIEDLNGLFLAVTSQIGYMFQQGMAEWDTDTTYFIGSMAKVNGVIYVSLADDNVGNDPTLTPASWKVFFNGNAVIWGGTSTLAATTYTVTPNVPLPNPVPEGTIISFRADAPNNSGTYYLNVGNGQGDVIIGQGPVNTSTVPSNMRKNEIVEGQIVQLTFFNTPINGPRWFFSGLRVETVRALNLSNPLGTLNAIVANTNDYAPDLTPATWDNSVGGLAITLTGNYNLTGLVATSPGHRVVLYNLGGGTLTLKPADGGSSSANQFAANADVVMAPGTCVDLQYMDQNFWAVIGK